MNALTIDQMQDINGGGCGVAVAIGVASLAAGTAALIVSGGSAAGLVFFGINRVLTVGGIVNACYGR